MSCGEKESQGMGKMATMATLWCMLVLGGISPSPGDLFRRSSSCDVQVMYEANTACELVDVQSYVKQLGFLVDSMLMQPSCASWFSCCWLHSQVSFRKIGKELSNILFWVVWMEQEQMDSRLG